MARRLLSYDDLPHSAAAVSLASPAAFEATPTSPALIQTTKRKSPDHEHHSGSNGEQEGAPKKRNKTRAEKRAAREKGKADGTWPGRTRTRDSMTGGTREAPRQKTALDYADLDAVHDGPEPKAAEAVPAWIYGEEEEDEAVGHPEYEYDDEDEDEEEWHAAPSFMIPIPGQDDEDEDGLANDDEYDGFDDETHGLDGVSRSSGGRQLTHAEIWEEPALVQAWESAKTEFYAYHAVRANPDAPLDVSAIEAGLESEKEKSALWWSSPAANGRLAKEIKKANQKRMEEKREEALQKRAQEKATRAASGKSSPSKAVGTTTSGAGAKSDSHQTRTQPSGPDREPIAGPSTNTTSKQNKQHTQRVANDSTRANAAWNKACRIVDSTPNRIGAEPMASAPTQLPPQLCAELAAAVQDAAAAAATRVAAPPLAPSTPAPSVASKASASYALPTPTPPHPQSDLFRNVTLAWYTAGFYTGLYDAAHRHAETEAEDAADDATS